MIILSILLGTVSQIRQSKRKKKKKKEEEEKKKNERRNKKHRLIGVYVQKGPRLQKRSSPFN